MRIGDAVLCTLCNVSTSTAAPTPRSGESTPERHQRAGALHKGIGAAGPKRKRPNGLERSVRRDATAKPHPASAICVLRSTSTSRQKPKPGQIDFWPPSRYGQRGDDPQVCQTAHEGEKKDGRPSRTDNVVECPPYQPIYQPTYQIQPSIPPCRIQNEYAGQVRERYGDAGPRKLDNLSRVVFITEPEGRAWRATDRLLADRCRGAPRPPKAPVMLAKPQFEPRS